MKPAASQARTIRPSREGATQIASARSASTIGPAPASGWPLRQQRHERLLVEVGALGPLVLAARHGRVLEADRDVQARPRGRASDQLVGGALDDVGLDLGALAAEPAERPRHAGGERARERADPQPPPGLAGQLGELAGRELQPVGDHVARARAAARPPR